MVGTNDVFRTLCLGRKGGHASAQWVNPFTSGTKEVLSSIPARVPYPVILGRFWKKPNKRRELGQKNTRSQGQTCTYLL